MSDRLEEALVDVISRIESGDAFSEDAIRAAYPDCWEAVRDVLDLRDRLADVGGLEAVLAKAHSARETKLRVVDDGRYEGFRLLGEGGMGMVYWALDTELNRQVAFKVVRPAAHSARSIKPATPRHVTPPPVGAPASQAFETLKARFLQEAWVTAGLEHPGIVPVYEVGQTPEGVPYYTMRFVRGSRTLAQSMDELRTRPLEERLALLEPFLRVCDTMRYAHAHGVIHRDLKPDNVALGEFGEVVVLDWGIAKIRDRPDATVETWKQRLHEFREAADLRTQAGALGTPGYMSPEAAAGRVDDVDERSDVYSLGAILFQILTGRLPYEFRTYGELLHAMHDAAPPEPASLDAAVPWALSTICLRALSRDRAARPRSVDELATELRTWLAKRARDHEVEVLEGEASAAMAAATDLEGDALLRQLDRVHSAATKVLDRAPASDAATSLVLESEVRRETGIRQREHASRRRTLRRAVVVGLAAALVGTATAAWVIHDEKLETERQKRETDRWLESARTERDAKTVALREARALALANASKAAEAVDPMRALLLAREAAHVQLSPAVVSQLHSALVGSLEDVVLSGHKGTVTRAVFSPRGDSVLTASADHTARIWKLDGSGFVELKGHGRAVWPAIFAPGGGRVLTGSEDGTARLWDLQGKEIRTLQGHTGAVAALAYSPDGDRFVTGSHDTTARLWDAEGVLLAVLTGHEGPINDVAWSSKGDRVVTTSQDGDVRVWDAHGALVAVLPHGSNVRAVAFSPDGRLLLTGVEEGVSRLWDVDTAQPTVIERGECAVRTVAFSPKGDIVAVAASWAVRLWSTRGTFVAELLGHSSDVGCTTFSPDGKMVATTGDWDGTARVWDLQGRSVAVLRGHEGYVGSVQFHPEFTPDRGRLLTASGDATARTWRLKGAEVETYRSVRWGMQALAVSGVGGRNVRAVPPEGPALLLDRDGTTIREYGETKESLCTARFSRDGRRVVTAGQNGWVRVFELTGTPVVSFFAHERACSADFSPDGGRILTWSSDATAKLWDLDRNCVQTFDEHEDRVMSAAFSPDGLTIVTGSWDCRARIWDVATGNCVRTLRGHGHAVMSAVFSHGGHSVLTTGFLDQTARIWDLAGRELHQLPHASGTRVAAFSSDDSFVAVGCDDGSTWLWDAAAGGLLSQLPGHSAHVIAVELDEPCVTTACADGNVRVRCTMAADVLDIVRRKITREFSHAEIEQYSTLLGQDYDALLAAYRYVEPRLASAVVVEDVVAEVGADASLGDDVRAAALRILERRRDDPAKVCERTWEVVRQAGRAPEDYVRALRWATIAEDLMSTIDTRLVLGVAQHRASDEAGALKALLEVDRRLGESSSGAHLSCISALALVHHAMGHDDTSRSELARIDRLAEARTKPVPFAWRVFLDEARALQRELGAGK